MTKLEKIIEKLEALADPKNNDNESERFAAGLKAKQLREKLETDPNFDPGPDVLVEVEEFRGWIYRSVHVSLGDVESDSPAFRQAIRALLQGISTGQKERKKQIKEEIKLLIRPRYEISENEDA